MSQGDKSCLVEKLSSFIDLDDVDAELLAALEKESLDVTKHQQVWNINDQIKNLFVVRRGWLVSYTILQDGRRQVLEIHYPGDVIGFADMPFRHSTSNLLALEDAELCPFPKSSIDHIFRQSPRLTALLVTLSMIDKAVTLDRLRVLGRMSARERVAHLMLEVHSRLELTGGVEDNTFRLPLSQFEIGDAVGLTNVSVSNALAKLESDGLLKRNKGFVKLVNVAELRNISDYLNRYREVDIGWFPDT